MISFELSDDQQVARAMFETLATDSVAPFAAGNDSSGSIGAEATRAIGEIDILSAMIDAEAGDDDRSRLLSCLLLEELGRADTAVAVALGAALGYARAILGHGTADQVAGLKAAVAAGHPFIGAVSLLEPGFGAGRATIETRALTDGDGYRLSGVKAFVPAATDRLLVIARLEDGHGAFLVDRAGPGMRFQPTPTIGLRGLAFGQLHLDDAAVPAAALLGGGPLDVQPIASAASTALCAILTGIARAVFDFVTPYTKDRVVHGSPLAQKQSVAFRLADMAIEIPAMRWSAWRGAVALDKGGDAVREARLAQIFCRARSFAIADEGVQLLGGHGYMKENPVERWYRDARAVSLLDGIVGL